jgi:hypothetical protein
LPTPALVSLFGCQSSGKSKFLPPKSQPVNMPLPSDTAKKPTAAPAATLPPPTPPAQPVMTPVRPTTPAAAPSAVLPVAPPANLPAISVTPPEPAVSIAPSAIVPPKIDEPKFVKPEMPN